MYDLNLKVYVDGSFKGNLCRGAYVVLDRGNPIIARQVLVTDKDLITSRNVTGELFAASTAISDIASSIGGDLKVEVVLYHDYKGIADFITGKFQASKLVSVVYQQTVLSVLKQNPNITLKFVKVKGHSGNKWNDVVDVLAGGGIPNSVQDVIIEKVIY